MAFMVLSLVAPGLAAGLKLELLHHSRFWQGKSGEVRHPKFMPSCVSMPSL
jgi:hypothetical protein